MPNEPAQAEQQWRREDDVRARDDQPDPPQLPAKQLPIGVPAHERQHNEAPARYDEKGAASSRASRTAATKRPGSGGAEVGSVGAADSAIAPAWKHRRTSGSEYGRDVADGGLGARDSAPPWVFEGRLALSRALAP